jgi:hypothetical protein
MKMYIPRIEDLSGIEETRLCPRIIFFCVSTAAVFVADESVLLLNSDSSFGVPLMQSKRQEVSVCLCVCLCDKKKERKR